MGQTRRGLRWFGLAWGLSLCFGATLVAQQGPVPEGEVVVNKSTKVFHRPTCPTLKKASAKNISKLPSAIEAAAQGYKPCGTCNPAGEMAEGSRLGKSTGKRGTAKGGPTKGDGSADGGLRFSRDIAPILVSNCAGCHGGAQTKGQFNLSTFNGLMKGGKGGAVLVPGKPEESRLVLRVKHEGDEPKMPPGQRNLAAETAAKIELWVKSGARLDAGIDPAADLKTYAPTADDLRKSELARMSGEQRDKKAEEVAQERWKKASSKTTPELTSDRHFLLFSNLPKERTKPLLKALEAQAARVFDLLGPRATALAGPEKVSVYVFNEPNAYVEFVRANENREVESGVEAHGRLDVETPYLAAVDPLNGREESRSTAKKSTRAKSKADDEPTGAERTLAGLLTEELAASATAAAGKPPRWLTMGVGAFLASQVEPRSPYYNRLRRDVVEQFRVSWPSKAQEALGNEGDPRTIRAMGFSLVDWLASTNRLAYYGFVRGMLEGQEKLDEVIKAGWGPDAKRDQFIELWGNFVAARYGVRRR
jgi:hypothetical protein